MLSGLDRRRLRFMLNLLPRKYMNSSYHQPENIVKLSSGLHSFL